MLFSVEKTATKPTTAAAMARMVSNMPRPGRAATGAGAGRGAAADGRAAAAGAAAVGAGAGTGAAVGPPDGPPGGNVGSLIVGAAEGLGGKLMRTVSFLGWTLPVSFLGGTAPLGIVGMFSAINLFSTQTKTAVRQCQTRIPMPKLRRRPPIHRPVTAGIPACRRGWHPAARPSPEPGAPHPEVTRPAPSITNSSLRLAPESRLQPAARRSSAEHVLPADALYSPSASCPETLCPGRVRRLCSPPQE